MAALGRVQRRRKTTRPRAAMLRREERVMLEAVGRLAGLGNRRLRSVCVVRGFDSYRRDF